MKNQKASKQWMLSAVTLGVLGMVQQVHAQEQAPQSMERVEVTGSSIKRVANEAFQPENRTIGIIETKAASPEPGPGAPTKGAEQQ